MQVSEKQQDYIDCIKTIEPNAPMIMQKRCLNSNNNHIKLWFVDWIDVNLTCVPGVVAGGPRQVPGEREGQVKYSPGQNYYIVEVKQSHDDLSGVTDTCS